MDVDFSGHISWMSAVRGLSDIVNNILNLGGYYRFCIETMWTSVQKFHQTPWAAVYIQMCAKSNVADIKNLNYTSKALFGEVKKQTSKESSIAAASKTGSEDGENASEMYWLLQHKPKMIKIKKKTSMPKKTIRKNVSKSPATDGASSSSSKLVTEIKPPITNEENPSIPFDTTSLKAILKFPLFLGGQNKSIIKEDAEYTGRTPSVGKILQATMSESSRKALMNWKLGKIAELGEDGFKALQLDHLNKGRLLHKVLQEYLESGSQPTIPPETSKLWESVLPALETIKPKPELIEARVEHPFLKYRGIVDCVSKIGDKLSVIEWKKSDKLKTTIDATYDAPIQLCAYLGALSADPRYKLEPKQGYVIVAYTDSKPAEVHYMNETQLLKYWDIWLKKVQEFWVRTRDGTLPEPI